MVSGGTVRASTQVLGKGDKMSGGALGSVTRDLRGSIVNGVIGSAGSGGDGKKVQSALGKNTAAINANTRALGDGRGIYGGGQRAQRAFPSRLKGFYFNDKAYRQGLSTGLL